MFYFAHCYVGELFSTTNKNNEGCYTPDHKLGQCVELHKCAQFSKVMHHKPLPKEVVNFLKLAHCGFEGMEPKVCCALYEENELPWKLSSDKDMDHLLPDTNTCGLHQYYILRSSTYASIKEFPWLALLQYEKPKGRAFKCGGTLINKRYVLTSAHCVMRIPESWKLVNVRLGEHNLNMAIDCQNDTIQGDVQQCADAPIDVRIAESIVHEQYYPEDLTQMNDISLLRLNRDIHFTDFIRPICLPKSSEFLNDGNSDGKMTVAGWGLLSETRTHSHVKLKSRVPIKSYSECSSAYNSIHVDLNGQLCTEEQDSCTVDSGGPLMVHNSTSTGFNWYIVGVKSFGPTPCRNNNWPNVYTKVINYIDWIVSHMKP